ncbi:ThuA domain-containing protein [Coraliomargarita sp. W4R53]
MIRSISLFFILTFFVNLQAVPDWKPVFNDKPLKQGEVAAIKAALPAKAIVTPKLPRRVLIFSATQVARHRSIAHGKVAIEEMGLATGAYTTVISDDPANFEAEVLRTFDTVIMLNPTWDFFMPNKEQEKQFNASQLSALKSRHLRLVDNLVDYVEQGGGLVGIHAASDSCYSHQGYGETIGGRFNGHPWRFNNNVTFVVEDPTHAVMQPVFEGMKDFSLVEEIYQFRNNSFSRERSRVLLHLDTTRSDQVEGLKRLDGDYPVAWVQAVGKGRVFYTNIGHNPHIFSNPLMLKHYLAGIQFATGDLIGDMTPSGNPKQVKADVRTWTGSQNDSIFGNTMNWKPSEGWQGATVLRFDGSQPGDLDLIYTGGQGVRVLHEFTADQTGDVSFRLRDISDRTFAMGFNDGDTAISIAAGAGHITYNGQDADTRMVATFGSGRTVNKNFHIHNEGTLEFGQYVTLKQGASSGDHTLYFSGGGQTTIRGTIGGLGAEGGIIVDDEHVLIMSGVYAAKQLLHINEGRVDFSSAAAVAGDRESWAPIRLGNDAEAQGILRYIGNEYAQFDRRIQIGNGVSGANQAGSAKIENESVTGQLVFGNASFNEPQSGSLAPRTLTLGGSNSLINEISGEIVDNNTATGGTVGLIKVGRGKWILSGNNRYTGSTLVEQGVLTLDGDGSIRNSTSVMVAEGATLDVTALSQGLLLGSGQSVGGAGTISGDLTLTRGGKFIFEPGVTLTVTGEVQVSDSFTVNSLVDLAGTAINWDTVEDGNYTLVESDRFHGGKVQLKVRGGEAFIL